MASLAFGNRILVDICEYFEFHVSTICLFHKEQSICRNESEKHWRQVCFVGEECLAIGHCDEPFII